MEEIPTEEIPIIEIPTIEIPTEEILIEKKENNMKFTRNLLLQETDKYLLPYYPITPEQLEIVKEYRQALRNFTQNDYIVPDRPDFIILMN